MSLYTHPIFVFIHYMKENETSHTQYGTPTKNRFISTVKAGKSVHEAGSMFGIKKSSAHRIWKRYETSRNSQNLRRSGHPKEVSDRTKRLVVRTAITNHRKPFREIENEMLPKISESTVRNILAEEGYHRRAARKVPYLTKRHKVDRVWCLWRLTGQKSFGPMNAMFILETTTAKST